MDLKGQHSLNCFTLFIHGGPCHLSRVKQGPVEGDRGPLCTSTEAQICFCVHVRLYSNVNTS